MAAVPTGCTAAFHEQQVPPLRRRFRSDSRGNDKTSFIRRKVLYSSRFLTYAATFPGWQSFLVTVAKLLAQDQGQAVFVVADYYYFGVGALGQIFGGFDSLPFQ